MTTSKGDVHGSFRVLLVEDDQFKQELIEDELRKARPLARIDVARSVQQAVQMIRSQAFDLVILDIALPSHASRPGGSQPISQPSGGVEVLLELGYERRRDKVVIVTQYPEVEYDGRFYPLSKVGRVLGPLIEANIVDAVYFAPQDAQWRERLGRVCR
jgi:CheY-like chemotaxis protein